MISRVVSRGRDEWIERREKQGFRQIYSPCQNEVVDISGGCLRDDNVNYVNLVDDCDEDVYVSEHRFENEDLHENSEFMHESSESRDKSVVGEEDIVIPFLSQNFPNLVAAENVIRAYALKNGFAIKIQNTQRRVDKTIYVRTYVCNLAGENRDKEPVEDEEVLIGSVGSEKKKRRRDKLPRSGCKFRIYVINRRNTRHWEITSLELNHNHDVVSPSKMNLIKKERHVTAGQKNLIKNLHVSGIAPRQQMNIFGKMHGGEEYVMPFVPFTGVNHHYQSVLFGFVLMRDELKTTFEWVFGTWLEVVEGKAHLAIITDQDQAMVGEIQSQLPNMTHLLCLWHISNKFPEKLSTYYAKEEFKGDFNNCIYHSLTEEIFEDRWKALILKYKLEDNTWLQGLYNLKHKWIDAYTRNIFFAGQKTTSRSEGMNAFFDAYVGSCMGLKEFVEGAQKALERQFMREKEEDYNTHHKICYMRLKTALEQHAASIYTKDMFKKFQDQLVEAAKYFMEKDRDRSFEDVEDTYYKCYRPLMVESKRTTYLVTFYKLSFRGSCICRMFEHSGMSCRHIIIVLTKRCVAELPEYFVKRRWTRDANRVDGVCGAPKPGVRSLGGHAI
ncbi:hypothetical protein AgCh_025756 [Apium graveolens]